MPAGVGSARKRRSPAAASSSSSVWSSRTSPSSIPASSVSSPLTARTSSTTPTDRRRSSMNRSARSISDVRSVCHLPRSRTSGSFAAASSASSSSVSSTSPIASRQSNEAIASVVSRPLDTAGGLVATRLTVMRLVAATHSRGQPHRDVELLEPGHRLAQERSGLGGVELDGARRIALELDPDRGEDRLDQLQAQLERAAGIALAEEREHVVAAFAQEAGRECERRVVRRLEPELEDDGRRLGAHGVGLVQPEAEVPRRARAARQAFVDPGAQPSLEGRVAVVGGELGLAAARPARKLLGRAARRPPGARGTSTAPRSARRASSSTAQP